MKFFSKIPFSIWIVIGVGFTLYRPETFLAIGDFKLKALIIPLLQVVMFGMGSTMGVEDFQEVIKSPKSVILGVFFHFLIMPLVGYTLTKIFTFPNEIAAGGGAKLQAAGLEVTAGVLEAEAAHANRAWLSSVKNKRPYFTWKVATTLDGKIAASDGSSKWISNEQSRNYVAALRNQSDAILVGTGTVITDDPNLVSDNRALRIAVGAREIPATAKIKDNRAPFYHHQSQDLTALAKELHNQNIVNVLVEAGPTLGTALLKAGLIDELAIFTAPKLLGSGQSFIGDLGRKTISEALQLKLIESKEFDGDIFNRYQVVK